MNQDNHNREVAQQRFIFARGLGTNRWLTAYGYDDENSIRSIACTNSAGRGFTVDYTNDYGYTLGYRVNLPQGDVFTRTIQRDTYRRNLITSCGHAFNGTPLKSCTYSFDTLNRVTRRINGVTVTNSFGYNIRSEVISASISNTVAAYAYDNIGNNLWTSINFATNTYTANSLNQYSQISVPSVPSVEALSYDLDGNLLTNGVFSYSYDAENRLIAAYSNSVCVISNAYDYMSRRVIKVTPNATHTFIYDGWNLVQETIQNQQSTITNHYVLGKDLSGTMQGAGGVGGLLAVSIDGAWYFPFADANGNITAYVNESGVVVAEYTYDAFGETITQSGSMSEAFVFRFSTKYYDTETELYYYGLRFYSPRLHRWMNRDPIEERGGLNPYAFCGNDGENQMDVLGLWNILRNGKNWAEAIPERGDTYQELADLIKLNYAERTKWLKYKGVFIHADSKVKVGCVYEIPNTMAVYTSKSKFGDGIITYVTQLRRRAVADGEKYKQKKYKVELRVGASSEDQFSELWNTDGICAISFAGHGDNGESGFKADVESGMAVNPCEVAPPYKLQAVRAYACKSDREIPAAFGSPRLVSWRGHKSEKGSYIGFTGWANWVSQFWQTVSVNPNDIPD